MVSELDIAWCAGLFDGEGCVHISKSKNTYNLSLSLSMTHKDSIYRFRNIIDIGTVQFMPENNPKWRDMYRWFVSGHRTSIVAKLLLPYLFTKKEQAERLIEFDINWRRRNQFDMPLSDSEESLLSVIISELKDLNKVGKR